MCAKFRIISIEEAQKDAEAHPDENGYIYYWRTTYGQLRKTGWVAICECRSHQYWGTTQADVCLSVLRLYPQSGVLMGINTRMAKVIGNMRFREKQKEKLKKIGLESTKRRQLWER